MLRKVAIGAAVVLGILLVAIVVLTDQYKIPSGSMKPTLDIDDRIIVDKISYRLGDPEIGDIAVFHPPAGADMGDRCGTQPLPRGQACPEPVDSPDETAFVKRVVAGPGDTLSIEGGLPIVDGEAVEADHIAECAANPGCDLPKEITIPPDHYFMMGDNSGASDDSRFWGPVPSDWIIGKAVLTYWPPDRVGIP